jgi:DNA-binding beta-propeller fold protein YncE
MRGRRAKRAVLTALLGAALGLLGAAPAQASRALLDEEVLPNAASKPPPAALIEGACGLAVAPGLLYVSDYYNGAVKAFSPSGGTAKYVSQIAPVGASPEGPCGLARSASGALYANVWHQRALRLLPSAQVFDTGHESTGVAVDPATSRLYVDNRTYVAAYEPSGAPVESGGEPLRIGEGSLVDAYGAAAAGGRVYVADAATGTVKAFEASGSPSAPVATISHGFVSLVDAALAIDPSNGNLVVADDIQPGYEHPLSALYEFESSGAFLGQLACNPVHGGPSGLAFDAAGNLYVTNGNGPGSNVFEYGPYVVGTVPTPTCGAVAGAGGHPGATLAPPPSALASASENDEASVSQTVQSRGVRVSFGGALRPKRLPRRGSTGVRVSLSARISAPGGAEVPQLRRIAIEINRVGRIDPSALPACRLAQIQPSTNNAARAVCGRSLVGEGSFSADVRLPEQSPFPSQGRVLAFNGAYRGRPAILAHVYGTRPLPTSYTLPLAIGSARGAYGTSLRASVPEVTGDAAAITGLTLNLGRSARFHGRRRPYISAGCPAPAGARVAPFKLARASFGFPGRTLRSTLSSSCRVR